MATEASRMVISVSVFFISESNMYVSHKDSEYFLCIFAKRQINGFDMNRTIITVVGKDTVGIIAKVCTYLADNQINILDISQTIIQGFFNMMMIVDTSKMKIDYVTMIEEITRIGEDTGVQIKCQREDIFDKMHRI